MKLDLRILLLGLFSLGATAAIYTQSDRPYQFDYDDGKWELVAGAKTAPTQDVDKEMAGKTLTTLQRKEADEKYRARFSVVVDDPSKLSKAAQADLAGYAKHAMQFMKDQRFHILSSEAKILPRLGVPAYEIVANQRDFGLTFRQIVFFWDKGGKREAYLLTAATRTNKYDAYKAELDQLFNSFAMKP